METAIAIIPTYWVVNEPTAGYELQFDAVLLSSTVTVVADGSALVSPLVS